MSGINWKDIVTRTAKTAVAVFLAVVPATAVIGGDVASIKNGLILAGASVVTAVWNLLLQYSQS